MFAFLQSLFDTILAPSTLWIALWSGIGILSLSFIVLLLTRFGQARPLSKCIALSVFAHFLLIGYAHLTQFWVPPGGLGPAGRSVRVTFVESPDPVAPADRRPWERLPNDLPIAPEPVELDRLADDSPPLVNDSIAREAPPLLEAPAVPIPSLELPPLLAETPIENRAEEPPLAQVNEPRSGDAAPFDPIAQNEPAPPAASETNDHNAVAESRAAKAPGPEHDLPEEFWPQSPPHDQQLAQAPPVDPYGDIRSAEADAAPAVAPQELRWQRLGEAAAPDTGALATNLLRNRDDVLKATNREPLQLPRLANGRQLPSVYQNRLPGARLAVARRYGGDEKTETAVNAALQWLAANQHADGHWDPLQHGAGRENRVAGHDRQGAGADAETGITGLALLAFLAAGNTHLEGEHRACVQRGLEYLLARQAADGHLAGDAKLFAIMYCHGMATLAVSEAYALTGDERLRPALEKAIRFTLSAQHPTNGGWRYRPGDIGDTSQFGWQVMALKSAEQAGIEIPAQTRQGMERFLQSVSSGRHGGLASYRAGEYPSASMTAEALACRFFLNTQPSAEQIAEATDYILRDPPSRGPINLYYWYYATLALHQTQSESWETWNDELKRRLLDFQEVEGDLAGSWPTNTVWGSYGGRVYTTAMGALCLEVYYRHLPLYGAEE